MNRICADDISAFHVAAINGCGEYCFVVYATYNGHQYVFAIEASNNDELISNIQKMFESIKSQYGEGKISRDIAAMVSSIILKEHSNAQ